jgi:hypothetical protein
VIDPGDLGRVEDVIDDAVERERSGLALEEPALIQEELRLVLPGEPAVVGGLAQPRVLLLGLARQEGDAEGDPHDASVPRQGPQLVVGQVARMIVQLPATGVAGDHRARGGLDRVAERSFARVGEVDEHPQLVHRSHDLASERGEARGDRGKRAVPTGADPREVVVPDERQHPHAVLEELAQAIEALLDRVAALDARDPGDRAGVARRGQVASVPGEPEALGMAVEQHVELAQERFGPRARPSGPDEVLGVDPGDEDHRAEPPLSAPDEVEMSARPRAEILLEVELALEGVDVRVEHRQREGLRHDPILRAREGSRQARPSHLSA